VTKNSETVSPVFGAGETGLSSRSTVFASGLFGGDGLFFVLVGAAGFGQLLRGLFLVRFWGFIAHDIFAFG
jgi:hypothetical protein